MLEVGTKAPEFTLPDKNGNPVSLADFAGKKVVLYFYPKDNTPGCTRQACAFAGAYEEFKKINAVVIGVSKDSVASHQKFAEKHGLPFILLSDPELTAIQAYGVWQEKKLYGKVSMGVVRSTFVINENGMIEKAMPKVKPDTNAAQILEYLTAK
ncbi:thioredoxin-dependent thiol peroxidase [Flintibacter muris]|uniref:thioredoxin-dependent thiol peroxidase n=1 Tax=Flintibacter muris TaxID=2941327 RepID=UPI00203AC7B6|nr:thioredoxin-dependent thiol peroxidase [Flintibacter muris]